MVTIEFVLARLENLSRDLGICEPPDSLHLTDYSGYLLCTERVTTRGVHA